MSDRRSSVTGSEALVPSASLRMRKLNLNLPDDYYKRLGRPTRGPFGLTPAPSGSEVKPISGSALSSLLKPLLSVKTSIEIKNNNGRVQINLSGATAEFKMPGRLWDQKERTTFGATVGYDGSFQAYKARNYVLGQDLVLKEKVSTASGQPFRLEYMLDKLAIALSFKSNDKKGMSFDQWEFSVSWGKVGPDIQKLKEIMTNGEASIRGIHGALGSVRSLDDMKSVVEAVKPHIGPIKKSIDAAASIMAIEQGVNISFKIQGPCGRPRLPVGASPDDRIEGGVRGMIYLTIRF